MAKSAILLGNSGLIRPVSLPVLPITPLVYHSTVKPLNYHGPCCVIKRASDSATKDIFWAADGGPDKRVAADHIGSSTAIATTLYDFSGNNNHSVANADATAGSFRLANKMFGRQPITLSTPTGAVGNVFYNLAAISLNRQAYTVYMVIAPSIPGGNLFGLGTDAAAANNVNVFYDGGDTKGNNVFVTDGGFKSGPYLQVGVPNVVTVKSDATTLTIRVNGITQTRAAATSQSLTGGYIGRSIGGGTNNSSELFAFILCAGTNTDAQDALVEAALRKAFNVQPYTTTQFVVDGDSIPAGANAAHFGRGYIRQTVERLSKRIDVYNIAVPGQTIAKCHANLNTAGGPVSHFNPAYKTSIILLAAITNDINNAASGSIVGVASDRYTNRLLPYVSAVKTAGYHYTLVGKCNPRVWSGSAQDQTEKAAEAATWNTLLDANAGSVGFIPWNTDGTITVADLPDNLHPGETGSFKMSNEGIRVLGPLI